MNDPIIDACEVVVVLMLGGNVELLENLRDAIGSFLALDVIDRRVAGHLGTLRIIISSFSGVEVRNK
jgi:hypothetical protein